MPVVKRPRTKDMSTLVAEEFAGSLAAIEDSIRGDNPVGFGLEQLDPKAYRKKLLNMSPEERKAEIETRGGIEAVATALRED